MQRVINFSGGKTSAYMTIMEYQPGDIVLFCDTGREHEKTYKFINDFEAHEQIPIIRLARSGGFEGILSRRGNKTLPNRMRRFCTDDLKIITAKRYLREQGIQTYENLIGFRYDEPGRVNSHKEKFKKVKTLFPLYEKKVTRTMIDEYWRMKPYTLEIPRILGNCTLCFMKGPAAIMAILTSYPELADPWIADEERNMKKGHTYFPGISIRQLRSIAQNNLFAGSPYDIETAKPDFNCACTT
jgi:hypothetical protein